MPAPALALIIDCADPRRAGLCALVGSKVVSPLGKKLPPFTRSDGQPVTLRFVQPAAAGGYDDLDVSQASVRIAIGLPDQVSTAGEFAVQVGASLTPWLPYNATAAQVSTALNALAEIIAVGGVTVTNQSPGSYLVTRVLAGSAGSIPATNIRSATVRIYLLPPTVTGYTGGSATNLDGQPTVGAALGSLFMLVVNGVQSAWRIEAGTAATDVSAGVVRPLDYDPATNAVNLVRVQGL